MNLKETVDLCKSGRAEEAYNASQKQLAENPDDRYARVGAAYSIKALMEQFVSSGDDASALRMLDEFAALRLDEIDEAEMNNRIVWAIRSMILRWKEAYDFKKADTVFDSVKNIAFLKPHRYYSVLLDSFLKIKDEKGNIWPSISSFLSWWGLENLLPEDFERVLLTNGQRIPSLAERAYSAALKSLADEVAKGNMIEEAEAFIGDLEVLEETHPEYSNILYRKAHLLDAMGRPDEARAAARAFVRKRPAEYWAWTALSDVAESEEMRAACLCRALACRIDPMFQGKIRYKLAVSMYNLGELELAKREFEKIVELYTKRGWHMPGNLDEIMQQEWYLNTYASESNRPFYNALAPRAEEYLNNDVPEVAVLISNFNPQKQTAGYITADRRRGFFMTKNLQGPFMNHQICLVRFDGEPGGEKASKVVSCRRVEDASVYDGVFYRQVTAPAGLRPGQSFLFVDDIYIDGNLLRGIPVDTMCVITAVLYYNLKKGSWGWRAVRVHA